jgi:outer membrane protein assembly factor BamD
MIKTVDRDPEPVYKALDAFEKLLKEYPDSRYEAEARDRIRACHNFIAEANLFVGKFYYRRDAYLAAAHRFEAVVKQYPDMDVAADALYYLALTYNEIGADQWAKERLIELAERYPQNKHRAESQRLLVKLNGGRPIQPVALAGVGPNGAANGLLPSVAQTKAPAPVASPQLTTVSAIRPAPASPAISANRRPPIPSNANSSISATPAPAPHPTVCRLGVWC